MIPKPECSEEEALEIFYSSKLSQPGIEEWKAVPGYASIYQVSNLGRVRSLDRKVNAALKQQDFRLISGKVLMNREDIKGRAYVHLCLQGRKSTYRVHTLVALAFLGNRPEGLVICHNNGNNSDNRLFNLRYDTPTNNAKDMERHGTKQEGERHHAAKLTNEEARKVIELLNDGQLTHSEIIKLVPSATRDIVKDISRSKTWKSLAA